VSPAELAEVTARHGRVDTRVDVALRGVRTSVPIRRSGGAGPSNDGHVLLAGQGAALPFVEDSPYSIDDGRLFFDGEDTGMAADTIRRPAFYDLTTSDGLRYDSLARMHGDRVLATTVVQTCTRYDPQTRCRFCSIEESLRSGATTAVKSPAQLAEVAEAAVRLDGARQLVMTTGTSTGRDRGARHLARCVRAVKEVVPALPIQVQCEPPEDLAALQELHSAGADAIGIHIESMDDEVRQRWMPGKATVPVSAYWAAWRRAIDLFGRNRVSTYLLVGLGEDADDLVSGAADLIAAGVYPFVVPFRPMAGTLAANVPGPDPREVIQITERVAELLISAGMKGTDQKAGCAACGGCSALSAAGG
jgi:radical SAM protein (TIGR04043 family)